MVDLKTSKGHFKINWPFKENKTEQEVQIIESWKHVQLDRKEKIEWLKTEATLAQYDLGKAFVLHCRILVPGNIQKILTEI